MNIVLCHEPYVSNDVLTFLCLPGLATLLYAICSCSRINSFTKTKPINHEFWYFWTLDYAFKKKSRFKMCIRRPREQLVRIVHFRMRCAIFCLPACRMIFLRVSWLYRPKFVNWMNMYTMPKLPRCKFSVASDWIQKYLPKQKMKQLNTDWCWAWPNEYQFQPSRTSMLNID